MSTKLFNTLSTAGSILLLGVASASVPVWNTPFCMAQCPAAPCSFNLNGGIHNLTPADIVAACAGAIPAVICVTGGADDNRIDTRTSSAAPFVSGGKPVDVPSCVDAGAGDNQIYTGDYDDEVIAGTGNDQIITGGGDDYINAGDGDNIIKAGRGDDEIYAGAGDDTIFGQSGCDYIDAGSGTNDIKGGGNTKKNCLNPVTGLDPVTGISGDVLCADGGQVHGQGGKKYDKCYINTGNTTARNCFVYPLPCP